MRNLVFLWIALLGTACAQAQFSFLTDNRSVNISGYTSAFFSSLDENGDSTFQWQTNSYSASQTPASTYADLHGNVASGTNILILDPITSCYASSSASQNSDLMFDKIQLSSSITVRSSGNGGKCLADALSWFNVSFSVSSPIQVNLSVDWAYSTAGNYWVPGSGGCDLFSANDGLVWESPLINVDQADVYYGSQPDTFSTLLEPGDIYTLIVSMSASSNYHDNPATYVNYSTDITLTPVPEPSTWLLTAMGLIGLVVSRRRTGIRRILGF